MSNPSILVVDDMESMRALLCAGLRGLGYSDIATAADGEEALSRLRVRTCDLVLLDAEMPRLNGLETLSVIRADPGLRGVAVIMVTGRADAAFVGKLAELGVNGYLVKPVTAATLGARIDAALRKRKAGAPGA